MKNMSSSYLNGSNLPASPEFKPFTKVEHIKRLNDIDKSIAQLLQHAGLALQTLSSSQSSLPIAERKAAFQASTEAYIKTLATVNVGLKRSIWALEEAEIIPAEKAKPKVMQARRQTEGGTVVQETKSFKNSSEAQHVEGGMGKLDIGWLNSRSGRVDRDMEAELWKKARIFLEETQSVEKNGTSDSDEKDAVA